MPGHETAAEAVVDAVLTASRTMVAVAERSLGTAAEETTLAQYRALVVLASHGSQRMVDLARALEVTPSTAGRMCDRLLRKGLIRRHRARADRREVQVSITAAGRAVVDEATARRRALLAEILGDSHARPAGRGGRRSAGLRGRGRRTARQPVAGEPGGMTARAAASQDALPAAWAVGWLRASRAGLVMIALVIGAGSGLGAVVFRI